MEPNRNMWRLVVSLVLVCLIIDGAQGKHSNQQRASPTSRPSSPSWPAPSHRPSPSPSRPAPAPSYRPSPSPTYRPAPAPAYRPAPTYRPAPVVTRRPAPAWTYRPAPAWTQRSAPPAPTFRPAPAWTYRPSPAPTFRTVTQYPILRTTPRYSPAYVITTRRPSWPQPPPTTPRWSGRPAHEWPTTPRWGRPTEWATRSPFGGNQYPVVHTPRPQYPRPPPPSPTRTSHFPSNQWQTGGGGGWPSGRQTGGTWGNPSSQGGSWGNQYGTYGQGQGYGQGGAYGQKTKTGGLIEKVKTALKNPSTQRALKSLLTKAFSSKKKTTHTNTRYAGMPVVYGANNRPYYFNENQYPYGTSSNRGNYAGGTVNQNVQQPSDTWSETPQGGGEDSFSDGGSFSDGLVSSPQPVTISGEVSLCTYDVQSSEAAALGADGNARVRQIVFECAKETEICCGLDCCPASADLERLRSFINSSLAQKHGNMSASERWNLTESFLNNLEEQSNGTATFTDVIDIGGIKFNVTELQILIDDGGSDTMSGARGTQEELPLIAVSVDRQMATPPPPSGT